MTCGPGCELVPERQANPLIIAMLTTPVTAACDTCSEAQRVASSLHAIVIAEFIVDQDWGAEKGFFADRPRSDERGYGKPSAR